MLDTTVHELLHALGLAHSPHPDSYLRVGTVQRGGLPEADRLALQFLYEELEPGDGPVAVRRKLAAWDPPELDVGE